MKTATGPAALKLLRAALTLAVVAALVELAHSRVAAIESVRLYHARQPEEAHRVALERRLNHFETVELAVRGIDLGLMVTTELAFVRLRSRERFEAVREPLLQIDRPRVARIDAGFGALQALLSSHSDAATVHAAIVDLAASLTPR